MARHKLPEQAGVCLILSVAAVASAQTVTSLVSFDGSNGHEPYGPLVQAPNGDLYWRNLCGRSQRRGNGLQDQHRRNLNDAVQLYGRRRRGAPAAGLPLATDGNLYGTTYYGGANAKGTVFKISPSGALTTLHCFTAADGANPQTTLRPGSR